MVKKIRYYHNNKLDIEAVLLGRKIVNVSNGEATLDNGRKLRFRGHEGGCSCGAGDYDLTSLNAVDNIITKVEFLDEPRGDYTPEGLGTYRIFVYAENKKINLATFTGNDGNGYYGTGYSIEVVDEE